MKKYFLLLFVLLTAVLSATETASIQLFPNAGSSINTVISQMRIRSKGTQTAEKDAADGKSFIRMTAAPGAKAVQMMANVRPAACVGGAKIRFSAKVRGKGEFDTGLVTLMNSNPNGTIFSKRHKLADQWQDVSFILDIGGRNPDQILCWIRCFGENASLDIADIKFEKPYDPEVKISAPETLSIIPAGGRIAKTEITVSGNAPADGVLAYIMPGGKPKKITVKKSGSTYIIPEFTAVKGVHHFAFTAAGNSAEWNVMAVDKDEYQKLQKISQNVSLSSPVKLLILGDSLSDFRRGYNWADILTARLKQIDKRNKVFNYGCAGDALSHIMKRLSGRRDVYRPDHYKDLKNNRYDLILIFAGQNDTVVEKNSNFTKTRFTSEQLKGYWKTITAELKKISPAAHIAVISAVSTPQEINTANQEKLGYRFGTPQHVENYNSIAQQICSENKFSYIDIYTPGSKLANKAAFFQNDGVHVNDAGNLFIAAQVMNNFASIAEAVEENIEKIPAWEVDTPAKGVWVLRNESGQWKGMSAKGVVPQSNFRLVVRKDFDLSHLPEKAFDKNNTVFLRIFIGIVDWSMNKSGPKKGLNEKFYIALNGKKYFYSTNDSRFPRTFDSKKKRQQHWCDIEIPIKMIENRKKLTVELAKTEEKGDDFIYPGFDGSKAATSSFVSYDGGKNYSTSWQKEPLGELMMRLVITEKRENISASFFPAEKKRNDPGKIFLFCEDSSDFIRLEFASGKIDFANPVKVKINYKGGNTPGMALFARGGEGEKLQKPISDENGIMTFDISGGEVPVGMNIYKKGSDVTSVSIEYLAALSSSYKVNLNPAMSAPAGKRDASAVKITADREHAMVSTEALAMEFALKCGIDLKKITVRDIGRQIVRFPRKSAIFKIKKNKEIFTGRNAAVEKVEKNANKVNIHFSVDNGKCKGIFSCGILKDEISWDLELINGEKAADYTVVFPHIDGLVLSEKADSDYYMFPSGGGVIAGCNTILRSIYGVNDAWFQLIDIFSPELGGGFAMRITDTGSIFKAFNLRKGKNAEFRHKMIYRGAQGRVDVNIQFSEPLDANHGTGIAVDYQRKKLAAGKNFKLPGACFASHTGNWKTPMKAYSRWGHKVWNYRPMTGKIHNLWNLWAGHGIGRALYLDGKYHERYVSPNADFLELISYWTVSPTAPWGTPIDKIEELGSVATRYKKIRHGYWIDPATGKYVYSYNRGDYDGYNPQWGGLPALQKHIRKLASYGKTTIFYTDPIIVCPNTKLGKSKGEEWSVVNFDWKDPFNDPKKPQHLVKQGHAFHYFSYCMCLNNPEYISWIAKNMARLIKETGVDGIRLDEYGHGGYICTSKKHPHLFENDGENVWLQAIKHSLMEIRKETDKFNKDVLLMGEYQGTDAVAAAFDGALSYDVCKKTNDLRPVAINLFRFYFPECKLFELDESNKNTRRDIWLFNAMGVYNSSLYPQEYHDVLKKYTAAFNGNTEPLVDTLIPYVYANRFESKDGATTVYTIHNNTGHTVDEPLIEVPANGYEYFNGFTGEKITAVKTADGKTAIHSKLNNDKTFVLVQKK